jgi:hypothetical protein
MKAKGGLWGMWMGERRGDERQERNRGGEYEQRTLYAYIEMSQWKRFV